VEQDLVDPLGGGAVGRVLDQRRDVRVEPAPARQHDLVVDGVDTTSVARGGTRIGDAILTAVRSFPSGPGAKLIVLITDGEDHDSFPLDAAKAAQKAGVHIVAVGLGRRYGRLTLALHASVYALAGAVASGLMSAATLALATPASVQPGELGGPALFALGALAAVVFLPVTLSSLSWAGLRTMPRLVVVAAFTWTATGALVLAAQQAFGGALDAAALATVRTVALVAAALVLSRAARTEHGREAGWLVYPVIVLIGVKLLFADFPNGRPETLFIAMAAYGCALIVAPRVMRRAVTPGAAPPLPTQSA